MKNENVKEKDLNLDEFKDGILNTPYKPETLPGHSNHKIRRMMVEFWNNAKNPIDNVEDIVSAIKVYLREKNIEFNSVQFDPEATGTHNRLLVIKIMLEGTTYYKHIKPQHLEGDLEEEEQENANTIIF